MMSVANYATGGTALAVMPLAKLKSAAAPSASAPDDGTVGARCAFQITVPIPRYFFAAAFLVVFFAGAFLAAFFAVFFAGAFLAAWPSPGALPPPRRAFTLASSSGLVSPDGPRMTLVTLPVML